MVKSELVSGVQNILWSVKLERSWKKPVVTCIY